MVLELALPFALPPIRLNLIHATMSGTLSVDGITNGRLCGAVPADEINSVIYPAVADVLSGLVTHDANMRMLLDGDHSCDTVPGCELGSTAPCHCISVQQAKDNILISSSIEPDLDLDPRAVNPFVAESGDSAYPNDALSVGIGFEAAPAQF
jgi:hypothetical protein